MKKLRELYNHGYTKYEYLENNSMQMKQLFELK